MEPESEATSLEKMLRAYLAMADEARERRNHKLAETFTEAAAHALVKLSELRATMQQRHSERPAQQQQQIQPKEK